MCLSVVLIRSRCKPHTLMSMLWHFWTNSDYKLPSNGCWPCLILYILANNIELNSWYKECLNSIVLIAANWYSQWPSHTLPMRERCGVSTILVCTELENYIAGFAMQILYQYIFCTCTCNEEAMVMLDPWVCYDLCNLYLDFLSAILSFLVEQNDRWCTYVAWYHGKWNHCDVVAQTTRFLQVNTDRESNILRQTVNLYRMWLS